MSLITRHDILGPARYLPIRDEYRARVIRLKHDRRIDIGDAVTLVFENKATLCFQIEEMLRAETLTDEAAIRAEIDVYNGLMPRDGELSATMFLAVPRESDPRAALQRLIGLDEHLILHVGPHPVRARFEAGRQEGDRLSAVQYTRYPVSAEVKAMLRTPGTKLAVEIDHPNYRHRAEMSETMRASLAGDLDEG